MSLKIETGKRYGDGAGNVREVLWQGTTELGPGTRGKGVVREAPAVKYRVVEVASGRSRKLNVGDERTISLIAFSSWARFFVGAAA